MNNDDVLLGLNKLGYDDSNKYYYTEFDEQTISVVRGLIKTYFTKIKIINHRSETGSYWFKNRLEKLLAKEAKPMCITNGLFIYAMYLEGYKIKRDDLNARFNVSVATRKRLKQLTDEL